jgi:hypothetical protein
MFAAEFEAAQGGTRRRSPRAPISLDAQIGKSGRTLCKVIDVSRHGVRLDQELVDLLVAKGATNDRG